MKKTCQARSFALAAVAGVFVSPAVWAAFALAGGVLSGRELVNLFFRNYPLMALTVALAAAVCLWAAGSWAALENRLGRPAPPARPLRAVASGLPGNRDTAIALEERP